MSAPSLPARAAYLGPEGTFSYFAGLEFLTGSHAMRSCPDFRTVFQCVESGECELGLVPLENSLRGTVGQCFDLFLQHDVSMIAEFYARISVCLLGHASNPGDLSTIRAVYSHPQPLAQCEGWLRAHLPGVPVISMESTAAAAHRAASEPGTAALGHWKAAELLGLSILAQTVEDEADNWTRFVVIAKNGSEPCPYAHAPCELSSLLFTLPDHPGALAAVLQYLAEAQINMRKLESRPLRKPGGGKWKYAFFVDVECDLRAPEYAQSLHELAARCTSVRLLGSYPRGPELSTHLKVAPHA